MSVYNLNELLIKRRLRGSLHVWRGENTKKSFCIKRLIDEANLPGGTMIVEASTGNAAEALVKIAYERKHPCTIFGPEHIRRHLRENAELISPAKVDGIPPIVTYQKAAKEYAAQHNAFYINQFENPLHVQCYKEKGREIFSELKRQGVMIDTYLDSVGTGATLQGFHEALIENYPESKTIALSGVQSVFFTQVYPTYRFPMPVKENDLYDLTEYRNCLEQLKQELPQFGIDNCVRGLKNVATALKYLEDHPDTYVFTTIGD